MIVLYGNWGSGKSSVIKYIHDELNNDKEEKFISIIFDAWLYEKDDNLPYSLLEFILDKLVEKFNDDEEIKEKAEDALKVGWQVLESMARTVKFNIKTPSLFGIMGAPELNIECDMEKAFKYVDEKEEDNIKSKSYHQKVEELKTYFRELSELLESNNQRLIIFIDELDRCEAEHTLDLLASIKLFFSLGNNDEGENNIIYFVAVDKDGVAKAIKTRYGDIIKAEEYLEKIFNISFNMPKTFDIETDEGFGIKKFIMQYKSFKDDEIAKKLAKFFRAIKFTNPRHLKKVLNKYEILTRIKNSKIDEGLIPEIIRIENETKKRVGYLFDTIFVLYFIILYEVYPEKYLEVRKYPYRIAYLKYIQPGEKISYYFGIYSSYVTDDSDITTRNDPPLFNKLSSSIKMNLANKNYITSYLFHFTDIIKVLNAVNNENSKKFYKFIKYIAVFLSCVGDENISAKDSNLTERYTKAGITIDFWIYIKNNYEDLKEEDYSNEYPFTNLFKMAETLL